MLHKIYYLFPNISEEEKDFSQNLLNLFAKLPNTKKNSDQIIISPSYPQNSFPETVVKSESISFPKVFFDKDKEIPLQLNNLKLNEDKSIVKDGIGEYVKLKIGSTQLFQLSIDELYRRIEKHIVRIDHTGVNIPSSMIKKKEWNDLLKQLSIICNIYKYPTGEDWSFILPATEEEFKNDITEFHIGREPKFELVYDEYSSVPTIQFDIETDLIRKEVEELLPEPYGVSFPDLADFFRTVYIYHPWHGLSIRFDIRFKNNKKEGDWETGKWLVKDGGRI